MKALLRYLSILALALLALALLAGCGTTGDYAVIYDGQNVCISGMKGVAAEACYNPKEKTAFIRYADGRVENFKVVGGGYGAGKLVLVLESGGRITVTTDGAVNVEPPMPQV